MMHHSPPELYICDNGHQVLFKQHVCGRDLLSQPVTGLLTCNLPLAMMSAFRALATAVRPAATMTLQLPPTSCCRMDLATATGVLPREMRSSGVPLVAAASAAAVTLRSWFLYSRIVEKLTCCLGTQVAVGKHLRPCSHEVSMPYQTVMGHTCAWRMIGHRCSIMDMFLRFYNTHASEGVYDHGVIMLL